MRIARLAPSVLVLFAAAFLVNLAWGWQQPDVIWVSKPFHHLGDDQTPEWGEAPAAPSRAPLELDFVSPRANSDEWTLRMRHRHVDNRWTVALNGRDVAVLTPHGELKEFFYPLPPGSVSQGENHFSLRTNAPADDMTVGEIQIIPMPFRALKQLGVLSISVKDMDSGEGIPSRVTIIGAGDQLPGLHYPVPLTTAVRPGIVYPVDGTCQIELPQGEYEVWASHGTEWSADHTQVSVHYLETTRAVLGVRRVVDTAGFVATDTHIHTLTHSGHGDSSMEERQVTLAAEGVELAVATDHNHNTDYRHHQHALGLSRWFTPVVGNEVTTPIGHFNGFPLDPEDAVPAHEAFVNEKPDDWRRVVEGIRAKGAIAVILNHPRWPAGAEAPFAMLGLDTQTGARDRNTPFLFDATELVNSTTPETSVEVILQDWFALLNHGDWIMAVGSSDSHTVGDPVGEGRTYIKSVATDPARIDVEEAASNLVAGRSSVSLGLYLEARQNGEVVMGETLPADGGQLVLKARIAAAAWARPETVSAYVNGELAGELPIPLPASGALNEELTFTLSVPRHDCWVVFVARGPKPEAGFYRSMMPELYAITNPVKVDGDRNSHWETPRAVAVALLGRSQGSTQALVKGLGHVDMAVATQLYSILLGENPELLRDLASQGAPYPERLQLLLGKLPD